MIGRSRPVGPKRFHPLEFPSAAHTDVNRSHAVVVKQQVLDGPRPEQRLELGTRVHQLTDGRSGASDVFQRGLLGHVLVLPRALDGDGQETGVGLTSRPTIEPEAKASVHDGGLVASPQQIKRQLPPLTLWAIDLEAPTRSHRACRIGPVITRHHSLKQATALHVRCTALHEQGVERGPEGPTEAARWPRGEAPQRRSQSSVTALQAEGVGFEPTNDLTAVNGFRDRPVQPLRHPSVRRVRDAGGEASA